MAAEPIEGRLTGCAGFQKSTERDAWLAIGNDAIPTEGEISRAAVGHLCFARTPRLPGGTAGDAGLRQSLAESHEFCGEIGLMIRRILELPRIASGEDGRAGGCAF